jgi:hypothetical protein
MGRAAAIYARWPKAKPIRSLPRSSTGFRRSRVRIAISSTSGSRQEGYISRLRPLPAHGLSAGRHCEQIERDLRLAAFKAERTQIFRMVRRRELGSELARRLIREIDILEARDAG